MRKHLLKLIDKIWLTVISRIKPEDLNEHDGMRDKKQQTKQTKQNGDGAADEKTNNNNEHHKFSFIVDDGSHLSMHMIESFLFLFRRKKAS